MWRDIWRLFRNFICIVVPLVGAISLYCALFPEWYMDGEYAMYQQHEDYLCKNNDYNRTLILGDSRAKAAFIPEQLSEQCYSVALGGTTPVEGYYSLKEYLEHHPAPEYVIMAYAPMHYTKIDALWTRNIYFHVMNDDDAVELFEIAKQCEDNEQILREHYRLEYAMYRLYMPNKYCTALKNARFIQRYDFNKNKYEEVQAARGHSYFGLANGSSGVNAETKVDDFVASDVITIYVQKTLDLCEEQGIQVVVEQLPMNETSRRILTDDFKAHYREYMYELAIANPKVQIFGDFYMFPNDFFGDADHLNSMGANEYSTFMKGKYPNLFP